MAMLVLYSERHFVGTEADFTGSAASLGVFANKASSLRVIGGNWILWTDPNFQGQNVVVRPGLAIVDIASLGIPAKSISSVQLIS